MLPPKHDFAIHKCLIHNLVLEHVGAYFQAICALAPLFPTPTSFDTTSTIFVLILNKMVSSHFS